MDKDNITINRLNCRFENKSLEEEYLNHSWEKPGNILKFFYR